MLKIIRFLLIINCLFLQACQHNEEKQEKIKTQKQPNLNKAASFNVQLGLGYLKQGDRPRAKKKLLTALKQEPASPDVNAAMGYYLEKSGEMEKAKKYYLKAISLSAESGAQLNNYGTFLCRQGDYVKAETYFLKAVKDPNYVNTGSAYENAGLCVLAIPNKEKAKTYFKNALDQDPSRRESLYELVKLISKDGKDLEAFELLQQYPDLVLNDPIFLPLAKDIASRAGKTDIAAEYDKNLIKLGSHLDNSGVNDEYDSHNG